LLVDVSSVKGFLVVFCVEYRRIHKSFKITMQAIVWNVSSFRVSLREVEFEASLLEVCTDGVVSFEFLFLRVLAFEKFLIRFLQGEEGHGESDAIAISDEIHITRSLIPASLHNVSVFVGNDVPVIRMEMG
jgi:hypothetical protein